MMLAHSLNPKEQKKKVIGKRKKEKGANISIYLYLYKKKDIILSKSQNQFL